MSDLTWTFTTNASPADGSTLQKLAQSAIWQFYLEFISAGWVIENSRLWTSAASLTWGTSTTARSYVMLRSPFGFCPGPDSTGVGAQSQAFLCIECLGTSSSNYSNFNATFYASFSGGSDTSIPSGGTSLNSSVGVAFMPSTLVASKISFARTSVGGIRLTMSSIGTGIVYNHFILTPLLDVMTSTETGQKYAYPVFMGMFFKNNINNMDFTMFDSALSSGQAGIGRILNHNGTPGVAEVNCLGRYSAIAGNIKVVGSDSASGNLFGDQIDSEIFILNSSGGSFGVVGRIPDYLVNGNFLGSGSTFPKIGTATHCIIGSVFLPSDANLQAF